MSEHDYKAVDEYNTVGEQPQQALFEDPAYREKLAQEAKYGGAIGAAIGAYPLNDDGYLRQQALSYAIHRKGGRNMPATHVIEDAERFLAFLMPRQIAQTELTPKS